MMIRLFFAWFSLFSNSLNWEERKWPRYITDKCCVNRVGFFSPPDGRRWGYLSRSCRHNGRRPSSYHPTPISFYFPVREREKFGRVWKRDAIEKELMQRDGEEEEEEGRNNLKIHNQRAESRSSSSSWPFCVCYARPSYTNVGEGISIVNPETPIFHVLLKISFPSTFYSG